VNQSEVTLENHSGTVVTGPNYS